jgi:ATP-binding cassette subfamily F protein 3
MSLVIADGLSLAYGSRVLLEDECFAIGPTDRIGLVGPNGTGKSTLMKILDGAKAPDDGELHFMRGARVGYLPQDLTSLPEGPLVDAVMAQVPGRTRLEEELAGTTEALTAATDEQSQMELAQHLADLQATADHFDERFGRHRAEAILAGLGFRPTDLERSTAALSGGWRMRAALAGLLLSEPDLLMLDEPTNHLDVPTLAWFDAFLRASSKALLLVSHDRDFLNRQISRVLSFEPEGLRSYAGNYDDYRRQRTVEAEQLESRAARQAARRAEIEQFITRFRAKASKARQVKSKEKMLARQQRIEVLEQRKTVSFRFPEVVRSGREVLKLDHVRKAFGDNVVYRDLSMQVLRGDRIAIVGVNGAGKSTLLKLVAGEIAPDAGEIAPGHNVTIGYYAQHHTDRLKAANTVLSEIAELVPDKPQSWVRGVLGSFLFSGDDVDKPISALSGGERARVALAHLLVLPSNLLLMDEPTNHLDLDSSEALIEALRGYGGTLLFVSHNRSFVNQLATKVWDIENGQALEYPGNLDDYLHHKHLVGATEAASPGQAAERPQTEKERKRAEAEARQARSAREKPIRAEIARIEARVAELESAAKVAEAALADPELYADYDRARPHMDLYRTARAELEALYERWDDQQRLLEAVAAEPAGAG